MILYSLYLEALIVKIPWSARVLRFSSSTLYAASPAPCRTPLAFALLSSSSTSWFLILDGIGPLLRWSVGASGLSAGSAAAAALELEAAST